MDLIKLVKHKFIGNKPVAKPKLAENQIDPEHFFEKISFQNLYSDLMETVEVDINELNNINVENPQINTNSMASTNSNSSYVNSLVSSFRGEIQPAKNMSNNEDFVRSILNEDEKKPRKILRLKGYLDRFFNRVCEKKWEDCKEILHHSFFVFLAYYYFFFPVAHEHLN